METAKWFTGPVLSALVLGVIIGFALGTYTSARAPRVERDAALATTTASADLDFTGAGVSVKVADQPAGKSVMVSDVQLDKVAWVAVRNYDNQKLGYVIGAHRLAAGAYVQDEIDVLLPTVAGKTYAVTIFYDNGDLVFDGKTDTLVTKDSQPLVATFVAK